MDYIYQTLSGRGGKFQGKLNRQQRLFRYTYASTAKVLTVVDFVVMETPGNISCHSSVASSVREHEPHLIMLAGIAGSLDHNTVKLGDVVVSERVKFFQPDKIRQRGANEEFVDDPISEIHRAHAASTDGEKVFVDNRKRIMTDSFFRYRRDAIIWNPSSNLFQDLKIDAEYIDFGLAPFVSGLNAPAREPEVHFGAVLGSDWVVDSAEFIAFVNERNGSRAADVYTQKYGMEENERSVWFDDDLLSVDTESYGLFRALRDLQSSNKGSMALVVRGISDLASAKEEHDQDTSGKAREIAARNSVQAALAILDRVQNTT